MRETCFQVVGKREFGFDNLLVRIHFIIVMTGWTGLAPCEFEFLFPSQLTSTLLVACRGNAKAHEFGVRLGALKSVAFAMGHHFDE